MKKMTERKLNSTEEAFLLSTFSEFVKCWRSRKNSRLFVESVKGLYQLLSVTGLYQKCEADSVLSISEKTKEKIIEENPMR